MTKLTENSFRDVNIALANELALISKNLNINVWELIDLANRHPRVNILNPGAGVGGHCIAVDPWFIVDKNPEALLIKQSRLINDRKPLEIVEDIKELCSNQGDIVINKIGLFGLSYKPDIDDLRESPSLEIALNLAEIYPEKVYAIEPNLPENEDIINNTISLISYDEAFSECDLIVILVPHTEFKEIFSTYTTKAQILDYCGLLHKKDSF
jgi:UDP-N-acetyl-D-mannosaminuronic acid dehydrogenase